MTALVQLPSSARPANAPHHFVGSDAPRLTVALVGVYDRHARTATACSATALTPLGLRGPAAA